MTQLPLRTLGIYLLIWLLFFTVPAARSVVTFQMRRLRHWSRPVWFGLAVGVLLVVSDAAALWLFRAYEAGRPQFDASGVSALILWVTVVATTEEMMLRGLLLTRFKELIGPIGGVIATSAIFALMHVGRTDFTPLTVLQYFADGIFLGWITLRTGDIWSAVAFHFGKNLMVALLLGGSLVAFGQPLLTVALGAEPGALALADVMAYLVSLSIGTWLFADRPSISSA